MSRRTNPFLPWLASLAAWPALLAAATVDDAALVRTPPMGWNSWNYFGDAVTDADIRRTADLLVSTGMAAAGYRYVIIDDGWQGQRDAQGRLHPNAKFPDMKALADYVHGKGLKFGIYSSPGEKTCSGYAGSYGHEAEDARTFASWDVDYLKYDLCSYRKQLVGKPLDEQTAMMKGAFRTMRKALDATGRPVVYALCSYGWGRVWEWGGEVGGNLWRTTIDIEQSYQSMMFNASAEAGLEGYAGPGHWNDPDMLEVGNKGFESPDMQRTHMSLWVLLAAPLIAGNDLAGMSPATREVLTDPEVLAIGQDARGVPGRRVQQRGAIQLWARPLADGSVAVGLLNTLDHATTATLDLHALGMGSSVSARDVWQHRDLGPIDAQHVFEVPTYGTVLLKLKPAQASR
ncbi:glycoside hydrolase family 27 protein [Frateuria defendens]|uniref:glycoside hydrolase family 27 protein n=1 Tax=Frateuria defendens TaxID=2219559 RepID=UPI00069F0900|nr:glycoside hydrolase family 27 protein [Frateuria defendens]